MSFQLLRSLFAAPKPAPTATPADRTLTAADRELTATAASLLRQIGCGAIADRVVVRWNRRLSSSAGLARPSDLSIALNPRLVAFPAEVDRTLRHELAHLVAFSRARRGRVAAHGAEWRRACVELGIPGESRCHTLPLPRRSLTRLHVYRCPGCGFLLRRVRRINLRRQSLACRDCCQRHARGRFDPRFQFVEVRS